MTMSVPFASRQTAFTAYKAVLLPLPQMDEDMAINCHVEAEYLAVSENLMDFLQETNSIDILVQASIEFHETLATENKDSSRLAMLFFGNIMGSLEYFVTVPVPLLLKVEATNLGYELWLIFSAQANCVFKKNYMDATTLASSKTVKGCRVCSITVESS